MNKTYYGNPYTEEAVITFWELLSVLALPTDKRIHFIFSRYITDTPEKIERLLEEFFSAIITFKETWDDELYPDEAYPITEELHLLIENDNSYYSVSRNGLSLTSLFDDNSAWQTLQNKAQSLLDDADLPICEPKAPFNYACYDNYSDCSTWWDNIEEKQ